MTMQPPRQPQPAEVQSLQQLFQNGLLPIAEAKAKTMLAIYPQSLAVLNILGMSQQSLGKKREAIASFQQMLSLDPRIAEIHYNVGAIYSELGESNLAIACYRKALQIKPKFTVAHFNLGALLQGQGLLQEAAFHYQQALAIEPGFFEALGNLGTVLQLRGRLDEAQQCYRRALALRPDARGHFNLGTTLYNRGEHADAIKEFREAVRLDPQFADAWNDLGETLRDRGEMDEALRCYRQALSAQPAHGRARYNIGETYCLAGQLVEAIPYFDESDFADAQERSLQCLYKTSQFEIFKQRLDQLAYNSHHSSILLGTLSTHYSTNFRVENSYNFCKDPMNFAVHTRIDELGMPESPLLKELLHDIQHLAIAERKQGRLYYGLQSAGNLLMRSEVSFQKLAALIKSKVMDYRQKFATSSNAIITEFPNELEFASSWYLRMKQGGYLTSHIHEEGWISGCVYLTLPEKNNAHEGSFEYGTDGDEYPRLHDDFPSQIVDQQVGDLVLFPSSLFHRTIPFHADQERVCVAFDVKPAPVVLV